MATTIYVGNLPFESSEVDVETLFAPFGEVQLVRFVIDHSSSNGQCYAFVDMQEEDATEATSMLDGMDFRGQRLVVNIDRHGKRRSRRDSRSDWDESGGRRRRKPQKQSGWEADGEDDEDDDDDKDDDKDDSWRGDEEDISWHSLQGWNDEDDEGDTSVP
jgi:RNA recognition motif-containing protein